MWVKSKTQIGFTIVELLIVVVVIGILAAITIVAYNGLQNRARQSQVLAMSKQAKQKIQLHYISQGSYPATLSEIGIADTAGVTYDYTLNGDWFCVAAKTTGSNPIAAGFSSQGNCSQLNAMYYNNTSFSGSPVVTRIDPNLDYSWGASSPGPGIPTDNFSAVWTGYITAPVTDTYTLYLWYDDKLRLYLDNTLTSDQWATGCCTWRTVSYPFVAGQKVPIKVEMAEYGGSAGVRLQWSYTGQTQVPIPAYAFSSL